MIWGYLAAVALIVLAPLGWSAWHVSRLRGRRDAALALHRAQLAELDRDLAEHRILPAEHEGARLEVQRRLLAEADRGEAPSRQSGPFGVVLVGSLVACVAIVLYVAAGGQPDYAARARAAGQDSQASTRIEETAQSEEVIARLRTALSTMDSQSDTARRGYVMLGRAELALGHLPEAADAWRHALAARFDPELGAETAEVISQAEARVTPEAAGLFKRALAEAPPDAPWRQAAQQRMTQAGGS